MIKLKYFLPVIGMLLMGVISQHSLAYGPFASFFYSSSTCVPLTGGLTYHGTFWSSSADNSRVLCPIVIGQDENYHLQGDIYPKGSESSQSSQKLSCKLIQWKNWALDIVGSAECSLGKGDKFMGISIGTGSGGTAAQKAYFLAHPISGCYVKSGSFSTSSNTGSISTSGSSSVLVNCPLIRSNQSHQKTARFHFSERGDAFCTVYGLGLYGQQKANDFTEVDGVKEEGDWYVDITLPADRNYLFAECLMNDTGFYGISY